MLTKNQIHAYLTKINLCNDDIVDYLYLSQVKRCRNDKAREQLLCYKKTVKNFLNEIKNNLNHNTYSNLNKLTITPLTNEDIDYINNHFYNLSPMQKDFVHLCRTTDYSISTIYALLADKYKLTGKTIYNKLIDVKPANITHEIFALRIRRNWL